MMVELLNLVVTATALRRRPFAGSSNSVARLIAFESLLSLSILGNRSYLQILKHL
jgi:hypothetical protein